LLREDLARQRKYHCFASTRTDIDGKQTHNGFRLPQGTEFLSPIAIIYRNSSTARRQNGTTIHHTLVAQNRLRLGTRCRHLAIA
jgi:hypothetical protein